jgi:hypothetical protein
VPVLRVAADVSDLTGVKKDGFGVFGACSFLSKLKFAAGLYKKTPSE